MTNPLATNIRDSDKQIELLEGNLIDRCVDALNANEIAAVVDGVFSLDQLEGMMEDDLDGRIGVGIGYLGCKVAEQRPNPTGDQRIVNMVEYLFTCVLAVPVDGILSQRLSATNLLTVLRKGILGKPVEVSRGNQRPWQFVQEKPEVDESTPTMLYYTQVWRLLMPVVGTKGE